MKRQIPWRNLRRQSQVPPNSDWTTWLILAGRGWGKTRVGSEWVLENSKHYGRFVLAGRTSGDLRDIMIEGESGIMTVATDPRPHYEPSKRRITFPSGAVAVLRSADEPEGFRGLQAEAIWADELAAWEHPEAWDQLQLGFRLGSQAKQIVTTTPRPTPVIRDLMNDSGTVVTGGSTYENRANLSARFMQEIVRRYEGTRLGRQELYAELLDDLEGALWKRKDILLGQPPQRYHNGELKHDFSRKAVSIDPAVTYGPESDETGIIVGGVRGDLGYVIEDLSGRFSVNEWARRAISAYDEHECDAIIGEVNNGGDLVEANLRSAGFTGRFIKVTASRGKRTRAEPIAGLYEQHRIYHLRQFVELEDQYCTFTPEYPGSPDRLDAAVWLFTELMLEPSYSGDQFSLIA